LAALCRLGVNESFGFTPSPQRVAKPQSLFRRRILEVGKPIGNRPSKAKTPMTHPFEKLPATKRQRVYWSMFAFTLFLSITISILGADLKEAIDNNGQPVAPLGIASFELVHNAAQADRILHFWGTSGKMSAALNLGFDFLFICAYANTIALGCVWLACVLRDRGFALLAEAGLLFAWLQWLAGLLDCIENVALIRILFHGATDTLAWISRWCAIPKFTLALVFGLGYQIMGLLILGYRRFVTKPTALNA
jgi:hypothetical protein